MDYRRQLIPGRHHWLMMKTTSVSLLFKWLTCCRTALAVVYFKLIQCAELSNILNTIIIYYLQMKCVQAHWELYTNSKWSSILYRSCFQTSWSCRLDKVIMRCGWQCLKNEEEVVSLVWSSECEWLEFPVLWVF